MSGYPSDLTLNAKVLPRTLRGVLDIADATEMSLATSSRAWKPYPPGNVRLNGLDYASWPTTTSGDVTLSWSHRNRTTQGVGGAMVSQATAGSYTCEGTLKIEVLIGGTVKRTWNGVGGLSQVYTWAQRQADDADTGKNVAFRITPINGSYTGTVRTTPAFVMGA